jgi:oxygen-dependent protoporphyrinogen oxidase
MAATMPEFLAQERESGSLLKFSASPGSPVWFPSPFRGGVRGGASRRTGHFNDQSNNDTHSLDRDAASGARYGLFVAPRDGMTSLVNALAARLPRNAIHVNTPITKIQRTANNQWQPELNSPATSIPDPAFSYDALILALPAHAAARLLRSCDADIAAELTAIPYAGCTVISLGFSRSQVTHPLDAFGFVVPQIENRRIIAASFASLKFPGRAPTNQVLIRVFIGGALQPELTDLQDDELRKLAQEELSALLGITGQPTMTDIARWPNSMPQYHVGHLDRVARIEQLAARHPRLALAGNAYHGVGIPQCIASGESAAEQIAKQVIST